MKINATVENAKIFIEIKKEYKSFDKYIWSFVGEKPIKNSWEEISEVPSVTAESTAMSKDLKRKGFKFVGPTTCYAYMQAVGMVNDHLISCFRYSEVAKIK